MDMPTKRFKPNEEDDEEYINVPVGKNEEIDEDDDDHDNEGEEIDEEEDEDDDEEARNAKILEMLMQDEGDGQNKFDVGKLKTLIMTFEKTFTKNQELRIKFSKNPDKFMDSEIDLDSSIRELNSLPLYVNLWPAFLESKAPEKMIMLLEHENGDIVTDVVEFFADMYEVQVDYTNVEILKQFSDHMGKLQLLESVARVLPRLDSKGSEEKETLHKALSILEHAMDLQPDMATTLGDKTDVLAWMLNKVTGTKEFDNNRLYASEILSILLQNSKENQFTFGNSGGIDKVLTSLSLYRDADVKLEGEKELVENIFDTLCSCLLIKDNQERFRHEEGVDLMLKIVKEKKFAAPLAIKTISFAVANSTSNCNHLIECQGLSLVFPIFMGKGIQEKEKDDQASLEEHVITIIYSLVKACEGVYLDRVINKFEEKGFEKLDRLVTIHREYTKKIDEAERRVNAKNFTPEMLAALEHSLEEEIYSRKLEEGLLTLQMVDFILIYLYVKARQNIGDRVKEQCSSFGIPLKTLVSNVDDFVSHLGGGSDNPIHSAERFFLTEVLDQIKAKMAAA